MVSREVVGDNRCAVRPPDLHTNPYAPWAAAGGLSSRSTTTGTGASWHPLSGAAAGDMVQRNGIEGRTR